MKIKYILASLAIALLIFGCSQTRQESTKPVNLIFIIPDGLSPAYWSTVRYVLAGPDGLTNLDRVNNFARYTCRSRDSWITDSAASITAMITGSKTNNGVINQDTAAVFEKNPGKKLTPLMEFAHRRGYATGIITTTMVYHATPAGCYANHYDRDQYADIAAQLLDNDWTPDIIIGGGRRYMTPDNIIDPEANKPGARQDGRNLIEELKAKGYAYLQDSNDFESWDVDTQKKVLGLFEFNHMNYEINRKDDVLGEPGLWELTEKTLEALTDPNRGFFLLVEAGRIDHAAHRNAPDSLLFDCIAFDKTVGVALDYLKKHSNTFILIAADHSTATPVGIGVDIGGPEVEVDAYPSRYRDDDGDGFPDDLEVEKPIVVGWASNPQSLRKDMKELMKKGYSLGSHTAEDCNMFAAGVGAEKVRGYLDNTDVYNILKLNLPREGDQGVFIGLNTSDTADVNLRYNPATAVFAAKVDTGHTWTLEILNMEDKILFLETKTPGKSKSPYHTYWRPITYGEDLPGLFKYRWYLDGAFQSTHTFLVQ